MDTTAGRRARLPGRGGSRPGASPSIRALQPGDLGYEAAVVLEACVPIGDARLELAELVAWLLQPHGLRRVECDAVLVPGEIPGDRDHDLGVDSRQRDDAGSRVAEALGDPGDRSPERARVEQICCLDDREL